MSKHVGELKGAAEFPFAETTFEPWVLTREDWSAFREKIPGLERAFDLAVWINQLSKKELIARIGTRDFEAMKSAAEALLSAEEFADALKGTISCAHARWIVAAAAYAQEGADDELAAA